MKTNKLLRISFCFACAGLFFACSKNNSSQGSGSTTTTNTQLQNEADDQVMVSNESDAVSNDANTALYSTTTTAGNSIAFQHTGGTITNGTGNNSSQSLGLLICDATITWDTTSTTKTITITYNGTNCWGNRSRTGVITITEPRATFWGDPGASVNITIDNLKITRVIDGKSIVINGSKTFTNVTGGHLVDLPNLDSIVHTNTGNMSILFDNGTTRAWNESKKRVFTYNDGVVETTTGTYTDSLGNSDVSYWGTNRDGISFEAMITAPKVIEESCDFRLVSGADKLIRSDNITLTVTYGLNSSGQPTSCPGTGTYYYEAVRVNAAGKTFTKIAPY